LIESVRSGQLDAYGSLYERHVSAAYNLARQLARSTAEADDLVSEAFAKVLDTLRAGRGPDSAFRAYLLTSLRHVAYDKTRRDRRVELTEDVTTVSGVSTEKISEPFRDTAMAGLERSLAAKAFARLPERWQAVLWHTEIEGQSAAEVAPLLGLTANGVSALAYRAREGLRQAYLQVHLAESTAGRCQATADKLGAWTRGGLSKRETAQVESHLDECERCRALAAELADVNGGLRVIATLVLGVGTAGYLATTAKAATAGIAVAAATTGAGASAGAASGAAGAASSLPRQLAGVGASVAVLAAAIALALTAGTTQHIPTAAAIPPTAQRTAPATPHQPVVPPPNSKPPSTQSPATTPNTTPPATTQPTAAPTPTPPPPPTTPPVTNPPPPPGQPVLTASGPAGNVTLTPGQGAVDVPITVGNTGGAPSSPITAMLNLPPGVSSTGSGIVPATHSLDAHPIDFVPKSARSGSTLTVQCPAGTGTVSCTTPDGLTPGDTVIMNYRLSAAAGTPDGTITGTVSAGMAMAVDVTVHIRVAPPPPPPVRDALTITARIDVWDSWWNWLWDGSPVLDVTATNTGTSTKPITVTVDRPGAVWTATPGCAGDRAQARGGSVTCTSDTAIAPGQSSHVRFRLYGLHEKADTVSVVGTLGTATAEAQARFTPPGCGWLWCWPGQGPPPPSRGSATPPATGESTPPSTRPTEPDRRPTSPSTTTKHPPTTTTNPPTTTTTTAPPPPPPTTTTRPPGTTVPSQPPSTPPTTPPGCTTGNNPPPGRIQPGLICLPVVQDPWGLIPPL
jgi:RNA polymerase sigma factor (sigma-70 family)